MPKTLYPASAGPLVHTGAGKLSAILVSNGSAAHVGFLLYDGTDATGTLLMTIYAPIGATPTLINFPDDNPVLFSTGLFITQPAGAAVAHVWAVGF